MKRETKRNSTKWDSWLKWVYSEIRRVDSTLSDEQVELIGDIVQGAYCAGAEETLKAARTLLTNNIRAIKGGSLLKI